MSNLGKSHTFVTRWRKGKDNQNDLQEFVYCIACSSVNFFFDCLWQNLKVILIFCIFMLNSHWGFRVLNKKTTVRRNPNNNLFALLMYKQQTKCWGHKFSWKINMYFIFSCTRKNKAIKSYQYRCAIASEAYFNDS